ncbi:hypothetical protein HTZ97_16215 [Desulfuromonas acetoxidans]|uniref:Uncharacterized protein n=1 Tax=Desulfuromonas acetoxidans (strain DSM 684 / 11070) TaxID=281689 RepID=Q1JVB2_DESA6|nr:hypothetical protein [Desulfuromonas acetoxidans]EAT14186.1 hypothetical protein Dace_0112 [Desulfuromonas acetoxidans DSM 684]EAT14252.1 hypothetical protein Dace_0094 [Desulfuromonas acetoxidans DSM 684]EAT16090.1 hypothetical protein Dace_2391 [Desulfuromonas acetoxidans DSM 684]MBF0646909.1 hypothetical protein [Desulfuromonas acetoxidans]NVD26186.1 hypothetical protein [Desulfuromonas acetoxidans]
MNRVEHLLTVLIEEAAEIQQAATKALRFGLTDGRPGGTTTNAEDIRNESDQLTATLEMLEHENFIPQSLGREHIEQKKKRVEVYMFYAKETGALID